MASNWNQNYESCRTYGQEISQKITEFQKLPNGSSQRAKLSATIRSMINEFNKDIDQLSSDLTNHLRSGIVTSGEADRRRRLIDDLKQRREQIESILRDSYGTISTNRTDPRLIPVSETEQTQRLTNEEFDGLRSTLRKNNDDAIEALHAAVKRQKQIGITMNSEIDQQNEIIGTLTDGTALLDTRIKRQTLFVKQIQKKSSACALWTVVALLLIAIIVIVAVPF